MKKLQILAIVALLLMVAGCTSSLVIDEGTYTLAPSTDSKKLDMSNVSKKSGLQRLSTYTEWKDQSDLQFLIDPPKVEKYGTLTLGNDKQSFKFALGQKNGFIDTVYFDQNGDGTIYDDEVIKTKDQKQDKGDGYNSYWSNTDDFPVYVAYKRADGTTVSKTIYIWLFFFNYEVPGKKTNNMLLMFDSISTYFTSEASITVKGEAKKVKFALIDGNNNGIFNESGFDFILIDKNFDGIFTFSKENQKLVDLIETTLKVDGEKVKKTLRVSAFAYPKRIVVSDVNSPEPQVEPADDDDWDAIKNKK